MADPSDQQRRGAAVERQADVRERHQEVGGLGRDHDVGRERQRAADPDRAAVDGRDHRLLERSQPQDQRVEDLAQRRQQVDPAVRQRPDPGFEVGAGGEAAAGAGQHDRPHLGARGDMLDRGAQLATHLCRERVQRLRTVQRDPRDPLLQPQFDGLKLESLHQPGALSPTRRSGSLVSRN